MISAFALLVLVCFVSFTAVGQSRPRRVTQAATAQIQETRPRRTRSRARTPNEAEAAKRVDTFIDRINRLVNEYLQPIRAPKP
jgi:hypothetical protein